MIIKSSKYIQINDFLLLEYEYNSSTISTLDANFLLVNNSFTNEFSYLNYNDKDFELVEKLTGNTLDRSAYMVDANIWLKTNTDFPLDVLEQQVPILTYTKTGPNTTQEKFITYDKVKFHIVSGYNFTRVAGFISQFSFIRRDGTNLINVANQVVLGSDASFIFNPRPFSLGDRLYDKYVEFLIPSLDKLPNINTDLPSPFIFNDPEYELAARLGDINAPAKAPLILFKYFEVIRIQRGTNGQIYLTTTTQSSDNSGFIILDVEKVDQYSQLSLNIQENEQRDHFEFFPLFDGELIEDYLLQRRSTGDILIGFHDIELFEHTVDFDGTYDYVSTQQETRIQENGYNVPQIFRPSLRYAKTTAFTIDYTFRLFNKRDNTFVVRKASLTSRNSFKYGFKLDKLNLDDSVSNIKIVNKRVISESVDIANLNLSYLSKLVNHINTDVSNTGTSLIPINVNDVLVSASTFYPGASFSNDIQSPNRAEEISQINADALAKSDVIWGRGDLTIYISEFDNFYKFNFYRKNSNGIPTILNTIKEDKDTRYSLVFKNSNGETEKSRATTTLSDNRNVPAGELYFSVSADQAKKILAFDTTTFYVTVTNFNTSITSNLSSNEVGLETSIYEGIFKPASQSMTVNEQSLEFKTKVLDEKLNNIEVARVKFQGLLEQLTDLASKIELDKKNADLYEKQKAQVTTFKDQLDLALTETAIANEVNTNTDELLKKFNKDFSKIIGK